MEVPFWRKLTTPQVVGIPVGHKICRNGHQYKRGKGCPACRRERPKKNYPTTPAKRHEYYRRWYDKDPAKARAISRTKRSRRSGRCLLTDDGSITVASIRLLFRLQNGLCAYCLEPTPEERTHMDHVVPLSRGGPHIIENIVISCQPCNLKKKDRLPEGQWMPKLNLGSQARFLSQ